MPRYYFTDHLVVAESHALDPSGENSESEWHVFEYMQSGEPMTIKLDGCPNLATINKFARSATIRLPLGALCKLVENCFSYAYTHIGTTHQSTSEQQTGTDHKPTYGWKLVD